MPSSIWGANWLTGPPQLTGMSIDRWKQGRGRRKLIMRRQKMSKGKLILIFMTSFAHISPVVVDGFHQCNLLIYILGISLILWLESSRKRGGLCSIQARESWKMRMRMRFGFYISSLWTKSHFFSPFGIFCLYFAHILWYLIMFASVSFFSITISHFICSDFCKYLWNYIKYMKNHWGQNFAVTYT